MLTLLPLRYAMIRVADAYAMPECLLLLAMIDAATFAIDVSAHAADDAILLIRRWRLLYEMLSYAATIRYMLPLLHACRQDVIDGAAAFCCQQFAERANIYFDSARHAAATPCRCYGCCLHASYDVATADG